MDPTLRIHVYGGEQVLARAAAAAFVDSARDTLSRSDRFTVALSGGSTPIALHGVLASELQDAVEWNRVHFFWVDERFVPRDDPESNYRMADETLFKPLGILKENIHAPDTLASDATVSAERYEGIVCTFFGAQLPRFDWMLLGMGEDGHIASLFPGSPALEQTERLVIAVEGSPKPPPVRVTMTLPLVNAALEVHFLVSGRRKHAAFSKILRRDDVNLPGQRVRPSAGTVDWWVDSDAALGSR